MSEKEAFCILLWRYQGGLVDPSGRKPIFSNSGSSGFCDEPTECYRCSLLQREISFHPPGHANWVCPACLTEVSKKAKSTGKNIRITGHYSEGQCQYIGCTRPPRRELREDSETDLIDLPKGHSRFLQLIIGDINT